MKIGVFDSGVGGQAVANTIQKMLPQAKVIYRSDPTHIPYGNKPIEEIHQYVLPILNTLSNLGCDAIVIACNTVSTNLIDVLRSQIPTPLIAMEPMVKPAVLMSSTKVITVCATPRTLQSKRYKFLKETYAKNVEVYEPDCSDWAAMIEAKKVDKQRIASIVEASCSKNSDVFVLGCTHYHWIEEDIKQLVRGRAVVIQPEKPVIEQLKRVLNYPENEQR